MVCHDSTVRDGETNSQRAARENRNADHARCRTDEANAAAAPATGGNMVHSQGNLRVARNLDLEFLQVYGHDVQRTPSANLAVAANELARLQHMSKIAKVTTLLKSGPSSSQ